MHRKLIERPRWGHRLSNASVKHARQVMQRREAQHGDWAALPRRQKMVPQRGTRKSLSDSLTPLCRFLLKREGDRWDDIYSELRQQMSPRSTIQMHIFEHIAHMVETDVWLQPDGSVFSKRHGRQIYRYRHHRFYVHPETGRLHRPTHRWKRPGPALPALPQKEHGGCFYLCFEGIWYRVERQAFAPSAWDVFSKASGADVPVAVRVARYGSSRWLAARKLALGRKALKRAGLRR